MNALEDAPSTLAFKWGRSLYALSENSIREKALAQRVRETDPKVCVRVFAHALRAASAGEKEARVFIDTLRFCFDSLVEGETKEQMREAALLFCEHGVLSFLDEDKSTPIARAPDRGSLAEKGVPLGVRKSRARQAKDDELDRLLLDPNPEVIANVLLNARMTEALVVRIASRKSAFAPILKVLARGRFGARERVRKAIVMNPHCPVALAGPILALSPKDMVEEVALNTTLSDEVRDRARQVLADKKRTR